MTLTELIALVKRNVDDASFTDAMITGYLNQAMSRIAAGIMVRTQGYPLAPLPDLLTSAALDLTADTAYVSMPADFQREIRYAEDSDGNEVLIVEDFNEYKRTYPASQTSTDLRACCKAGSRLFLGPVPSDDATGGLTIHYYRRPVDMSLGTDTPDGLPDHLHAPLLVNHATMQLFDLMEDGIEGQKVNTEHYERLFYTALDELDQFIPYEGETLETFPPLWDMQ